MIEELYSILLYIPLCIVWIIIRNLIVAFINEVKLYIDVTFNTHNVDTIDDEFMLCIRDRFVVDVHWSEEKQSARFKARSHGGSFIVDEAQDLIENIGSHMGPKHTYFVEKITRTELSGYMTYEIESEIRAAYYECIPLIVKDRIKEKLSEAYRMHREKCHSYEDGMWFAVMIAWISLCLTVIVFRNVWTLMK
jgi:hypothetical protein